MIVEVCKNTATLKRIVARLHILLCMLWLGGGDRLVIGRNSKPNPKTKNKNEKTQG